MKRYIFVVFAILFCAWFAAPFAAINIIEKRVPFVNIGSASFGLNGLHLHNVVIDKKNGIDILAYIKHINIRNFTEPYSVYVVGGQVDIEIINKLSNTHSDTSNSILNKIHLYVSDVNVSIKKKDFTQITLENVSYQNEQKEDRIWFESGLILFKSKTLRVTDGSASRDGSIITFKTLEMDFQFPFDIPLFPKGILKANGVKIDTKKRKANIKSIRFGAAEAQNVFAGILPSQGVFFISEKTTIQHRWIAPQPVTFLNIKAEAQKNELHDITITIGDASVRVNLKDYKAVGRASCEQWIQALPDPKPKAFQQSLGGYSGELSFFIQVYPEPSFKLNNSCSFKCSHEPIQSLINPNGFIYTAYDKDSKPFMRLAGPNTDEWVALEDVSPELVLAVNALEDPGFQSHKGILVSALQKSLVDNLKTGKFSRGGSTITMQLAKNLWLTRDKTLLRKVHEALLTVTLESCFTKNRIMEMYLNVAEFGSDIYGIGPGTHYHFDKEPIELTPVEAFFMAKVLPSPKNASPTKRRMKGIRTLMRNLANSGFAVGDFAEEN